MKSSLLLFFTTLTFSAFSQYEGFENWNETSTSILENYIISNVELFGTGIENTTRSEDAQEGDYSIRMETIQLSNGDTIFGFFLGGDPDEGIPGQEVNLSDVDSIIGYYKANILPNDSCVLLCEITASSEITGGGVFYLKESQTEWTRFAFSVNASESDSLIIAAATGNPLEDFSGIPGTWLMLDNIQLKAADGTLAQILNYSFEAWDQIVWEEPEGWFTSNSFGGVLQVFPIAKSTDAYSGEFAIELNTVLDDDFDIVEGIASNGDFGGSEGAAYTETPSAIELYYKFTPGTFDDIAFASFTFRNNGEVIGNFPAALQATEEYQLWTQAISISQPDTLQILIFAGEEVGSKLTIDNINFLFTVGENEDFKVDQVESYPNPASDFLNIRYNLKSRSDITITLTDMNGRILNKINKKGQAIGIYNEIIPTAMHPTGMYLLTVESASSKIIKKIILN